MGSDSQFGLVYNILSFSLASMMATTLFLWMRIPAVKDCYASALIISGEVTFIAAYHYLRIFNSWVEAYEYKPNSSGEVENPVCHWRAIQRCLPLHGLVLDSSSAAYRDRLRDEAVRRGDQEEGHDSRCCFRLDDLQRLPW